MTESIYGYWLPPDYSTHGAGIDALMWWLHFFMIALFVGWGIFMVYCLIRFRAKEGRDASTDHVGERLPKSLEIGVVVVETILLVGFSMPIWADYRAEFPDPADAVVVRVVAQQFQWNYHYPGPDGVFGETDPEWIASDNPLGIALDSFGGDPHAADDVVTNSLHVPVDRPVICQITSKDVIHSFFIPVMRVKMDANPGMSVPVTFTATETGEFEVACAQLCGNQHAEMRSDFVVESAEEFEDWLSENRWDNRFK